MRMLIFSYSDFKEYLTLYANIKEAGQQFKQFALSRLLSPLKLLLLTWQIYCDILLEQQEEAQPSGFYFLYFFPLQTIR